MIKNACNLIRHGISINADNIEVCCFSQENGKKGHPLIMESYDPENFDWDKLIKIKDQQTENQKNGIMKECEGCHILKDNNLPFDDNSISHINFNHWSHCNSKCRYCKPNKIVDNPKNIIPMIKSLIEKGLYSPKGEITFQGGEPTLLEEFEELIDIFTAQKTNIRIHSSGIKYSKALENSLKTGNSTLIVSTDSGKKETYKKIKRVDSFDKVYGNLKHYVESTPPEFKKNIIIKFIIMPGYNDTLEEIDAFFEKVKETGVSCTIIDLECQYHGSNLDKSLPNIKMILEYFEHKAKKENIKVDYYDCIRLFATKGKTKIPSFLLKTDFLFRAMYKIIKKQHSHLNRIYYD